MPSRDISDCVQELQNKWPLLRDSFSAKFPGWEMILTCTHRAPDEQFQLFQKGRELVNGEWIESSAKDVVTQIDGKARLSMHNYSPAKAFDVALKMPDGRLCWETGSEQWQTLPALVQALGLVSGGAWQHFKDFPHVQIGEA